MHRFLQRFSLSIIALSFLFTAPALYFSAKLFLNLKSSLYELLPTEAPSYIDLFEIKGKLPGKESLNVLIDCRDSAVSACKDYQVRLSSLIQQSGLESQIRQDVEARSFIERNFGLFIEKEDLEKIRDRLADEASASDALGLVSERLPEERPEESLDVIYEKYAGLLNSTRSYPDDLFVSPSGRYRGLIVKVPDQDLTVGRSFEIRKQVDEVLATIVAPAGVSVHFSGGVQTLIEEHQALMKDLILATVLTLLLVGGSLFLFFKDLFSCCALILTLLVGATWGFGISYFTVGYLNSNTAFLGAIVLGNGINFGIILLARLFEELRNKSSFEDALVVAIRFSRRATILAALGAGLAYGSLIVTNFRGFNQFGIVGFTGMVTCWLATYSLLPALLNWGSKRNLITVAAKSRIFCFDQIAEFIVRRSKPVVAGGVLLTVIGAVSLISLFQNRIETDVSKLRSEKSLKEGSAYYAQHINEIFGRYLSPLVLRVNSEPEKALELARGLRAEKLNFAAIYSLKDFQPEDQPERLEILREIQNLLSPSLIRSFPENQQEAFRKLDQTEFAAFAVKEIPEGLRSPFREVDGQENRLILLEPKLIQANWDGRAVTELVLKVRQVSEKIVGDYSFAGSFPLTADLYQAILADGPRATAVSVLLVILLLALGLRHFGSFFYSFLSLAAGVLWLCIVIVAFDFRINFLNFIVFPITFGISVDYAVNILCRWRDDQSASLVDVIKESGGAVFLCSLTTIIGYGSLILADNQALQSFGWLSVIGEITCFIAASVFVPALIAFLKSSKRAELSDSLTSIQKAS